jgi:hypothetical protein
MQEVQQLVVDDPADVNITSRRLEYIWQVGRKDMFEGMSRADEVRRRQPRWWWCGVALVWVAAGTRRRLCVQHVRDLLPSHTTTHP